MSHVLLSVPSCATSMRCASLASWRASNHQCCATCHAQPPIFFCACSAPSSSLCGAHHFDRVSTPWACSRNNRVVLPPHAQLDAEEFFSRSWTSLVDTQNTFATFELRRCGCFFATFVWCMVSRDLPLPVSGNTMPINDYQFF